MGAVAAACVVLGLADGGYGDQAFSVAALCVWAIVLIGLAAGKLPRTDLAPATVAAGGLLAGLVLLTATSLAWTTDDGAAFADTIRVLFYLGLFVVVAITAARGQAAPWLSGLAIGLTAIAAVALLNRYQPGLLAEGDLEIARDVPGAAGRLSYPIGYWNGLGAAMAIAIVLLTWVGARAKTRLARTLATAALPLPLLALYISTSRGGAIAAAIGVVALLALGPARTRLLGTAAIGGLGGLILVAFAALRPELLDHPASSLAASQGDEMTVVTPLVLVAAGALRHLLDGPLARLAVPRRFVVWTLAVMAVIGVGVLVAADPIEQWRDFKAPPAEDQNFGAGADPPLVTSSGRYQFWSAAVDAFEDEPLHGIGSGAYASYWAQHGSIAATARNAHSVFFETLAELGLLGLGCAVGFLAVAACAGWMRLRMLGGPPRGEVGAALAVLATGIVSVAVDWNYDIPVVFGTTIVAAGLLAGPATLPRLAPRVAPPAAITRSRGRLIAGLCVLAIAWAAICAAGLHFLSSRSLSDSEDALADGRPREAIEAANDAVDLEPWAAGARMQLALAHAAAGEIPAAQDTVAAAIDRAPDDWRNWVVVMRLELLASDFAGAQFAYRRVKELSPHHPQFQPPAAAVLDLFGRLATEPRAGAPP